MCHTAKSRITSLHELAVSWDNKTPDITIPEASQDCIYKGQAVAAAEGADQTADPLQSPSHHGHCHPPSLDPPPLLSFPLPQPPL